MNHDLNAVTKLYGVINLLWVSSHRMLAEVQHLQWKILLKNNINNKMLILLMEEKNMLGQLTFQKDKNWHLAKFPLLEPENQ